MQWRKFDQATVPQNEPFLLWIDGDLFFAKVVDDKLITKSCYNDICDISDHGVRCRGKDLNWFLHNLSFYKNVTPLWAHFHQPEASQ